QRLGEEPYTDAVVGAWNAGIIGFFRGHDVVDLDGLVDHDVGPYVVGGRLPAFVDERRITFIADFGAMLDEPAYRRRGGYDDPRFRARLTPTLVDEGPLWRDSPMTVWRL